MSFENLLALVQAEAEELKKSQSDEGTDEKIRAAADEAIDDAGPDEGDDLDLENDEDEESPTLTKSFCFTLDTGEVIEAEDGTELVKALIEEAASDRAAVEKVVGATLDLVKSMRVQQSKDRDLIKSLQGQVAALSTKGAGRKAVLSVNEKTAAPMRKSGEPQGMNAEAFMAKAMDAMSAGKLTGLDVARVESHLNHGTQIPDDIVSRVLSFAK